MCYRLEDPIEPATSATLRRYEPLKNNKMRHKILLLTILIFGLYNSNCIAQEFIFVKKINKHVFKPKKGKIENQYSFDSVEYITSGTWMVKNDGLYGVFKDGENLVIPTNFEKIDYYTDKSNLVKLNGVWGTYRNEEFIQESTDPIFRNPDHIAHLIKCSSDIGTNKSFEDCLLNEIYTNIIYPKEAIDNKIEGMMIAELIIDTIGNVSSVQILRGLEGGLTAELKRLIRDKLNNWKPAINERKAVRSRIIVAVRMKLN